MKQNEKKGKQNTLAQKSIRLYLILILILLFCIPVHADSFNIYGSVTEDTPQINYLISTLQNQTDYNILKDWIAFRSGQYDYSLVYNLDKQGSGIRLRYYATESGYNLTWHYSKSSINNFTYSSNGYTCVGSASENLGSQKISQNNFRIVLLYTVPAIFIVLGYFVFRIKKRGSGINI